MGGDDKGLKFCSSKRDDGFRHDGGPGYCYKVIKTENPGMSNPAPAQPPADLQSSQGNIQGMEAGQERGNTTFVKLPY